MYVYVLMLDIKLYAQYRAILQRMPIAALNKHKQEVLQFFSWQNIFERASEHHICLKTGQMKGTRQFIAELFMNINISFICAKWRKTGIFVPLMMNTPFVLNFLRSKLYP